MSMIYFLSEGNQREGYLALPTNPNGRAILVLHAWWGLTPFFKNLCDKLAIEGFIAFAPDLHHGKTASTIQSANQILEERDFSAALATAEAALEFFRQHHAVQGKKMGALGFSMGAGFALILHEIKPDAFGAVTMFYGGSDADLSKTDTPFLCHFAEKDEFEPLENVQKIVSTNATVNVYPGTGHWFFEDNRPEFDTEAAALAWQRTLAFFNEHLS
ncbi:MAG TPA: dienelactone hydrolase family protein [Anaerolineales bacterium]|nr:dienelactone hydrolase family protein [Anaerolineales bacterium]